MKKKLILLVLLVVLVCAFFVGCDKGTKDTTILDAVSELRQDVLVGSSDNFSVKLCVGKKEEPYIADGKAGNVQSNLEVTVVLKKEMPDVTEFQYKLSLGERTSEGILKANLFGDAYNINLKNFEFNGEKVTLMIKGGEVEETIELKSVLSENMIKHDEALKLATEELQTHIDQLIVDKKLQAEVHVKLINSASNVNSKYYWYVVFIKADGKNMAVLIDPETKEIAVKKIA